MKKRISWISLIPILVGLLIGHFGYQVLTALLGEYQAMIVFLTCASIYLVIAYSIIGYLFFRKRQMKKDIASLGIYEELEKEAEKILRIAEPTDEDREHFVALLHKVAGEWQDETILEAVESIESNKISVNDIAKAIHQAFLTARSDKEVEKA